MEQAQLSEDQRLKKDADNPPLPEEGLSEKRLWRARTLVSFLIALGVLLFFGSRLELDVHRIWQTILSANGLLFAAAFLLYYLTFPMRAARWRLLLENVGLTPRQGVPMPSLLRLTEMVYLSWFANCVIPAKLGDAYRGYQLKQAAKVSFSTAMGTILAERFIDMAVLVTLLLAAIVGLRRFGDWQGDTATRIFGGGVVLLVAGCIGLGVMWALRGRFHTFLPVRIQAIYLRFQEGTLGSFRSLPVVLLLSFTIWFTEISRLFLVIQALGLDLSLPYIVILSLANALLTVVPFTPGGLGLVEAGLVGLLLLFGINKEVAVAAALLDRTLSYWSIVLFGFLLFLYRRRV